MDSLASEVGRIVTCPYLPSLKPLHDILCRDDNFVLAWARCNPCQIRPLAEAVLESLESWPYALDILRFLAQAPAFRNEVLCQNPMILDTLLRNAVHSESGLEKYTPACIAMLCGPLSIMLPESYATFLSRLLDEAVHGLSYGTVKPVYQTISSLSNGDLENLPTTMFSQLQDSLIKVLMRYDVEEVSMSLFSLATLARLASLGSLLLSSQSPAHKVDDKALTPSQVLTPARQFFGAKRAFKTLDLVTLKAIMICSNNCSLSSSMRIENIKLCVEILRVIDSSEKSSWVAKNISKMKKLFEKMLRPDLDDEMQWTALDFLTQLVDHQDLPFNIFSTFETLVLKPHLRSLGSHSLICLTLANEATVHKVFGFLLEQSCEALSFNSESLLKLDNALKIAEYLTIAIASSPNLYQKISRSMSSKEGLTLLRSFVMQTEMRLAGSSLDPVHVCQCAFRHTHLRLREEMSFVLLSSAFRFSGEDHEALKSTLLPLLRCRMNTIKGGCAKDTYRPRGVPSSLFEAGSTPQTISTSHGWKENVTEEMIRDAHHRSNSVVRMVGEICRDLELRCGEAERPFREEQLRAQGLEAKLAGSESKIHELETESVNTHLQVRDLKQQNEDLEEQVKSSGTLLRDLSSSLDKVREESQLAKKNAELTAKTAIESARQQDVAYLATLAGKDDMYQKQASMLAASEHRVRDHEDSLAQAQFQLREKAEKTVEDNRIIEELRGTCSEQGDLVKSNEAEISRLGESVTKFQAAKNKMFEEAREAARKYDEHIEKLKSQILAFEAELVDLKEMHRLQTAEQAVAFSNREEQVQATINTMQAELCQARSEATKTLHARDKTIRELEQKFDRCWQEHRARERESAEAQDLISKLTAIVGTRHSTFLASAKKADTSRLASDDESAPSRQSCRAAKHVRKHGPSCETSSSNHDSPTRKRPKPDRNLNSTFAKDGKCEIERVNPIPQSIERVPLMALSETRPTHNKLQETSRQSKDLRDGSMPNRQTFVGTDENTNPRPKASEVFTNTYEDPLFALDGDSSTCTTNEETTSAFET